MKRSGLEILVTMNCNRDLVRSVGQDVMASVDTDYLPSGIFEFLDDLFPGQDSIIYQKRYIVKRGGRHLRDQIIAILRTVPGFDGVLR